MERDFYIELIYKSLHEKLSVEEQNQLSNWLNADLANQKTAENIKEAWMLSANYSKDLNVNLDDEFAKLQMDIQKDERQKNDETRGVSEASIKPLKPWRFWVGIAAAVLLLVTTYFAFNNQNEKIEYITVQTRFDEIKEVELSDGTKVWINENSTFTYPKPFEKHMRKVQLNGLAFFDVAKDVTKKFVIKTDEIDVTVLGTSFSVNAHKDEPNIEVLVKTGKVRLDIQNKNSSLTLHPNQRGIFDTGTKRFNSSTAKTLNELAWLNNTLTFDDTELSQVLFDIEKHYDVILNLKNQSLAKCRYNSIFKNKSLQEVLDGVGGVFKLKIEKTNDKLYELKDGTCPIE